MVWTQIWEGGSVVCSAPRDLGLDNELLEGVVQLSSGPQPPGCEQWSPEGDGGGWP